MKILLTTDGSDGAASAARTACRFLRREDRQMDLLCVAPEYTPRMTGWDESRAGKLYRQRILAESQRILGEAESALEPESREIRERSEVGSPQSAIVRASAGYDLTVVGARGRGERSEAGLGPVASHVLHHAPGSVLIGREMHNTSGFRVLVAVDGSTSSGRALDAMTALLDLESADVTLMHVMETPWIHLGLEREWLRFTDTVHDQIEPEIDWDKKLRARAQRVIDAAREKLRAHHPGIEVEMAEGIPSYEILSEADKQDCDLIVLGATGITDLKHQLLGSVSYKTAWDASCSVLVVRAGA
jgi:nucleotide-binding universal stress UspA family protein